MFVWTGDLDDDCTARWNELVLRAEKMSKKCWWWSVYDLGREVATSNNLERKFKSGKKARRAAEEAAQHYHAAHERETEEATR